MIVFHLARSAVLHKFHTDIRWHNQNRPTHQRPPTHSPPRLDLLHSSRTDLYLEGDIFQCRFVHRLFSHKNFRAINFSRKNTKMQSGHQTLFQILPQSQFYINSQSNPSLYKSCCWKNCYWMVQNYIRTINSHYAVPLHVCLEKAVCVPVVYRV